MINRQPLSETYNLHSGSFLELPYYDDEVDEERHEKPTSTIPPHQQHLVLQAIVADTKQWERHQQVFWRNRKEFDLCTSMSLKTHMNDLLLEYAKESSLSDDEEPPLTHETPLTDTATFQKENDNRDFQGEFCHAFTKFKTTQRISP